MIILNVSTPDDGLGDTLRQASIFINTNFAELDGNTVWIAGNGTNSITSRYGGGNASGEYAVSSGNLSQATGNVSHAQNKSRANGNYSASSGFETIANAHYSFVHGKNSTVNGNNSIVLGADIFGNEADTTYVDHLNIKSIGETESVNNLGIDENGNIVIGSGGSGGSQDLQSVLENGNIFNGTNEFNIIKLDGNEEIQMSMYQSGRGYSHYNQRPEGFNFQGNFTVVAQNGRSVNLQANYGNPNTSHLLLDGDGIKFSIRDGVGDGPTDQIINYTLPTNMALKGDYVLPISVNGNFADSNGNIEISGGSQDLQSVLENGDYAELEGGNSDTTSYLYTSISPARVDFSNTITQNDGGFVNSTSISSYGQNIVLTKSISTDDLEEDRRISLSFDDIPSGVDEISHQLKIPFKTGTLATLDDIPTGGSQTFEEVINNSVDEDNIAYAVDITNENDVKYLKQRLQDESTYASVFESEWAVYGFRSTVHRGEEDEEPGTRILIMDANVGGFRMYEEDITGDLSSEVLYKNTGIRLKDEFWDGTTTNENYLSLLFPTTRGANGDENYSKTLATTDDIPDTSNFVNLTESQDIGGNKTFLDVSTFINDVTIEGESTFNGLSFFYQKTLIEPSTGIALELNSVDSNTLVVNNQGIESALVINSLDGHLINTNKGFQLNNNGALRISTENDDSGIEAIVGDNSSIVGYNESISPTAEFTNNFEGGTALKLYAYDGNSKLIDSNSPFTVDDGGNLTANRVVASDIDVDVLVVSNLARFATYTVASLPTGLGALYSYATVTDALAPAYLATVVGGGSIKCPVFWNGTNWVCH